MRIGELAQRSGMSTATIRFYERRGVLPGPARQDNGYREYTDIDVDRAANFATFRGLGLGPTEAARLADQCATGRCDTTWAELPPLIAAQRREIADQMAALQHLDVRLAALQRATDTTGQSADSLQNGKEDLMLQCDCGGGCCGSDCC